MLRRLPLKRTDVAAIALGARAAALVGEDRLTSNSEAPSSVDGGTASLQGVRPGWPPLIGERGQVRVLADNTVSIVNDRTVGDVQNEIISIRLEQAGAVGARIEGAV